MFFKKILMAVALSAVTIASASAQQGAYPNRPVRLVIPFAQNGPTDVLGRIFAEFLAKELGQPVQVENVPGQGGMLGAQRVAEGRPDGYNLLMGTVGTHAVNMTLYRNPLYDAANDFDPIGLIAEVPLVLVVRKSLPINNFQDFTTYLKERGDKANYGSAGNGSATHLGCLLLAHRLNAKPEHLPYRGSTFAIEDMKKDTVDFLCDIVSTGRPAVERGDVRGIVMLSKNRFSKMPDLPTLHELGLTDFDVQTWNAVFAAKGTPKPVVDRLNTAIRKVSANPDFRKKMDEIGANLVSDDRLSASYLGDFVKSEIVKWRDPIKAAGVFVE